ncbi:ComEC/Rec2 family competence protein [Brevibacterium aurantiacum]|uniref:ComEC/Rec2 family competence protein n=1 Tax=Brevibacterium aurantiacum TaxID=273384 RepID=UPI001D00DBF1|nr:ComEC/Rec2 family competence protein [Brevibacterium aurantiacum]
MSSSGRAEAAKERLRGALAWVRGAAKVWPGSFRLLICALSLWITALAAPGPWALFTVPPLVCLGFLCLRRHHHLGVLLIVFACLLTVQTTMLGSARGPDEATEVEGIAVGHSQPGDSGWSRLTVLTSTGITEVLSPSAPPDGAHVSLRTEALDDIRISNDDARIIRAPNGVWKWRADLRLQLRHDSLASGHSGGALLPGLVVGDTEPQDARMEDDMRVVSLTHISAVSGSNVTIVSLGAGLLAGLCRAGPRTRVGVGVLTCVGYVFVVGFEPSAIRAAGMAIAVALVFLRGGGISPVAVMSSTVCILLSFVPVLATSVGFVLSVVSTAAILFVVPIILRRLRLHLSMVPTIVISALIVPLVAQLACTPVLVAIDPRIGLWSVAANALAAPAVLPATVLGFVSLVCGGLGLLGIPGLLWCAQVPAWLGSLCAWWIVGVARICAGLPGAALDWPKPPVGTLAALGLLILLAAGLWMLVRRKLWGIPTVVVCICLTALIIVVGRTKPPADDWLVMICDVGQGSATVINLGEGAGLVVDTGKDPKPVDVCLDEGGIEDFDLVISHFDADHSAGYAGTTWSRTLHRLWVSSNVSEGAEVRGLVADTGAKVVPTTRGRSLDAAGARIEVLWPPARETAETDRGEEADGNEETDVGEETVGTEVRNEDSLVLRVELEGLSFLVPGDIGEDEQFILAQSLEPVDLLIAPHHGSSDLAEDFFTAAGARLGVFSVGENSYGHPTPRAQRAFGPVPVLRTDRCGTVAVYAHAKYSTARDCHGDEQ